MDAASAFALACGVVQFVDFSLKVVVTMKELHDSGFVEQYKDLEGQVSKLSNLRSTINARRPSPQLSDAEEQEHRELLELADRCDTTAAELLMKYERLKLSRSRNPWKVLAKTIKVILNRESVENLLKTLTGYREVLDTRLLISLR